MLDKRIGWGLGMTTPGQSSKLTLVPLLVVVVLIVLWVRGCPDHAPTDPFQTDSGHGEVMLFASIMCMENGNVNGEIKWGDGSTSELYTENRHTCAKNGSYKITVKCAGMWPFVDRFVTQANVNTAAPSSGFFGLDGPVLSGIAALITAIVAVAGFLLGRKQKGNG